MHEAIDITRVQESDLNELQQIARQTFAESFAEFNTQADMEHYLNHNLSLASITNEWRDRGSAFYFARAGGQTVGYLKINHHNCELCLATAGSGLEIERLYILKEFHGKNFGSQLIRFSETIAANHNHKYLWLGVWENNFGARAFYQKLNFTLIGEKNFQLGNDMQRDQLLIKPV